jgi:hypothetical protein
MSAIASNLQAVRQRIDAACRAAGRNPENVRLLAVSKTWPASALQQAAEAGQTAFGENYVQESLAKIGQLSHCSIEWHFIGPLQSNKTRPVAENFAWVHGIDRLKIAERLSAQRPANLPPLQVCIEVNVSGEQSKSGCSPADVSALCQNVAALPRLQLRGLMAIPAPETDFSAQRQPFRRLRDIFEQLCAGGLSLDTLSMGMSHDLEAAIAEGATIVRVGTAIFGTRNQP